MELSVFTKPHSTPLHSTLAYKRGLPRDELLRPALAWPSLHRKEMRLTATLTLWLRR